MEALLLVDWGGKVLDVSENSVHVVALKDSDNRRCHHFNKITVLYKTQDKDEKSSVSLKIGF